VSCRFACGSSADAAATHCLLLQQKSRSVLVPAHPGNPGQSPEGRKTVVCVCGRDRLPFWTLLVGWACKQYPNAGNSRVAVELSRAEVERYQNRISGTSGHWSSTWMGGKTGKI